MYRTLPYSEFWHTENPRHIQNSVEAYSGIFRTLRNVRILKTLLYLELFRIQNLGIFQTKGIFITLSNIQDGGLTKLVKGYNSKRSILAVLQSSGHAYLKKC